MAPESTALIADETRSSVSPRKTRPSKPDHDKHKKELAAIDAKIDRLRKQQDEVRDKLNGTDPRKGPHVDKRNKLISRLQAVRAEQNSLRKSRGKVFDKQESLATSISKKTAELKAQQAKLTYKTVEEIDEAITKNEKRIESGNLKLVEERRLDGEISSLRRAKKHVEQAVALQKAIDTEVAELAEIDEQLAGTNARALSEEYNQLQGELDALKATQDEGSQKRGDILNERTRIMKELDQAWDQKRGLQESYRRLNNDFFQWQQEERKRKAVEEKQRRIHEQREKRLAIAQEQREEAEIPAFQNEIHGCDSLITYLRGILPSAPANGNANGGNRSENSTRPASVASNARDADASDHVPAGMVAVKKVDDEESYFAGVNGAKNRKKNARKDKKSGVRSDVLKHPLAVAERFFELQVEIPTTSASIPAAMESLANRKQYFVENQAKATQDNKRKAEEKIAKLMAELEVDEKIAEAE
ncbi:multicopy suppressor of BFA (Brefeldin A) [Coemansia spiralis]|uniref:Multicopy suppressor of BFA (Brefeldin A) n=2 Tax=Coemansia TaxID=4863 RepID=A0A9W8G9V0_9FUNG|nr:multicopy suppressor of BFA (Brefeldin A) [Coemansia sp. RSA 1358]KAJ2679035.1 multicopy suppressor of BFA (Brefeldin A) [Coemansia spiralis]